MTVLSYAAARGHVGCVRFVLEVLPDLVRIPDYCGRTAIALAASGGHVVIIRMLAAAGADPSAVSDRGLTPLYCE